ncbi:helix-turn-helix transcriptional regulator [Olsenella sp. YH-ols2217]|uniref:Helix-turn-helix transcriptional regulator n=1 Tax=Kribbibacterium absianum TaxID=3044210 RepID=A0ABT6ZLC4_9ACTN|nr:MULTISPECIES: helix-turn-helix transcriptional regulator [unclassified Olsenella]MDJ1121838.1 helix-turn-helix transcriptional regulator [Olsenella sp. YH-ols2216]MDJ1129846.1 helix-turn-helix transcriptional regulator [Olsenella sp. YH-ols2217]
MALLSAQRRRAVRMSQQELADAVGVTQKTISQWELGNTVPNADQLRDVSRALGTDPNSLLGWTTADDVDVRADRLRALFLKCDERGREALMAAAEKLAQE